MWFNSSLNERLADDLAEVSGEGREGSDAVHRLFPSILPSLGRFTRREHDVGREGGTRMSRRIGGRRRSIDQRRVSSQGIGPIFVLRPSRRRLHRKHPFTRPFPPLFHLHQLNFRGELIPRWCVV